MAGILLNRKHRCSDDLIRQILEYYFIQLSGYKGGNLRHDLLDKHKEDFEYTRPDGTKDTTDYTLASAMMALLDIGSSDFNDGLYFDSSATNVDRMKAICRRIFEVMHQEQHYDMMTNR